MTALAGPDKGAAGAAPDRRSPAFTPLPPPGPIAHAGPPPHAEHGSIDTVHLEGTLLLFGCFEEMTMSTKVKIFAIAAVLAAGTSSAAMAEYPCAPGYEMSYGVCRPAAVPGYPSGPLSGAAAGEVNGAANGAAAAGPVGAIIGGAIGTATGAVAGTANAVAGAVPPACGPGYVYYNGGCYPARY
jgi:hypothetical protein